MERAKGQGCWQGVLGDTSLVCTPGPVQSRYLPYFSFRPPAPVLLGDQPRGLLGVRDLALPQPVEDL